jgi:phytoene dehydrogenase-like protein
MGEITRRGLVGAAALAPLALPFRSAAQPAADPEHFDIVVAGAGHNGLACSAYLAKPVTKFWCWKGGRRSAADARRPRYACPDSRKDLCSSVHSGLQANPLFRNNELNLRDYGLEYIDPDPVIHIPFMDGASITIWRDLDRTCETIARFSRKDAETFRCLVPKFKANAQNTSADRGASRRPPGVWQRLSAMSGYDAARTLFESDDMRAACLSCGHFGGVPGGDFGTGNQAFSLIGQVLSARPVAKGGWGNVKRRAGAFYRSP